MAKEFDPIVAVAEQTQEHLQNHHTALHSVAISFGPIEGGKLVDLNMYHSDNARGPSLQSYELEDEACAQLAGLSRADLRLVRDAIDNFLSRTTDEDCFSWEGFPADAVKELMASKRRTQ